tara:strand:+ start:14942 stop:15535 length:594 start_codon:yes stop_codon:yes gene_type:complete
VKVCIVGNSPNMLDNNLGEKIDACDHVIRINDFVIDGFENKIGSKTTIVAAGFSSASKMVKGDYPTSNLMDTCDIWVLHPEDGRIHRVVNYGVKKDRIFVINDAQYSFLKQVVYKNFWRKVPSCGIATIQMALDYFENNEIFIVGFDENTGKEGKGHYYEKDFLDIDLPGDPVGHDWASENSYIRELVSSGKLKRLY